MSQAIGNLKGLKTSHVWEVGISKKPGDPGPTLHGESLCGEDLDSRGIQEKEKVTCKKCLKIQGS